MGRALSIGPVGTVVRTWGGLGLIYLAGAADGQPWDVDWYDPILGFVVLPVIMVAVRAWHPPLRIATDSPHRTARDRAQSHRDPAAPSQLTTRLGEQFCSTAPRCSSPHGWDSPGVRSSSSRTGCPRDLICFPARPSS